MLHVPSSIVQICFTGTRFIIAAPNSSELYDRPCIDVSTFRLLVTRLYVNWHYEREVPSVQLGEAQLEERAPTDGEPALLWTVCGGGVVHEHKF
jgi:hypothetical protein